MIGGWELALIVIATAAICLTFVVVAINLWATWASKKIAVALYRNAGIDSTCPGGSECQCFSVAARTPETP